MKKISSNDIVKKQEKIMKMERIEVDSIKIIIASHKKYQTAEEEMYVPIQVGAEVKEKIEGYIQDNTGDNISTKNPYYCELTGLYWAWKNLDADYIGLVHYRRYLCICSYF